MAKTLTKQTLVSYSVPATITHMIGDEVCVMYDQPGRPNAIFLREELKGNIKVGDRVMVNVAVIKDLSA